LSPLRSIPPFFFILIRVLITYLYRHISYIIRPIGIFVKSLVLLNPKFSLPIAFFGLTAYTWALLPWYKSAITPSPLPYCATLFVVSVLLEVGTSLISTASNWRLWPVVPASSPFETHSDQPISAM